MRTIFFAFAIISILGLQSCISVRALQIKPGKGGVVSVHTSFKSVTDPEARAKAMAEMELNCGVGRVKIIEEGYVKIGEKSTTTDDKVKRDVNSSWYGPSKTTSKIKETQSTDVTEWQIVYECI